MPRTKTKTAETSAASLGFEAKLWLAADKLRNNMDASEYKHVVLGLIFLKYISDSFEEMRARLMEGKGEYKGSDPEDPDEYRAENVFWVPPAARWPYLQGSAKQPTIGKIVDDAMTANRAISTLEFIDELIRMAKDMDAACKRGQDLGLNDDEVAFYDALATNDTAVKVMGDDKLKVIAVKLLSTVRKSVTIDWNLRESARAKIRVMVRRILREYGYPPDLQEEAVKTVLAQAELVCADWEG